MNYISSQSFTLLFGPFAASECKSLCPMKNFTINNKLVVVRNQCTMCYRCVNNCPKQAITLLGKQVVEQSVIEKYLDN